MKIPFVGSSYTARSLNVDAQRSVNCFVEMDNASPRAPLALYGTPGLRKLFTLPTGGIQAAISDGGYLWVVAGGKVYKISPQYVVVDIGSINAVSGVVSLASNGIEILIVDGIGGYIINIASGTFTQINDEDFPGGVRRCAYQDGYFIITGNDSQKFYISDILDGGAWDGLDFASAEGSPDNTIGIISDHRELWLFGDTSAEVWVNTGNPNFPFERSGNTFIEHGCAAASSISKLDNTVFWLGADDRGTGIVWRADGYTPVRISTHAIEKEIAKYESISDAYAFTYQQEGHGFYVLTFPSAGKTWCYDVATQQWHERAYRYPSTGVLTRWRPSAHVMFGGVHIVGDYSDGRMYELDLNYYTDDGDNIERIRSTTSTESEQKRIYYGGLQVDMETGVGIDAGQGDAPLLMMRYSNDGGHTWSNYKTATVGKVGEYGARCKFGRLGTGRNRVWEISMSDPVKFAVIGANVEAVTGTS